LHRNALIGRSVETQHRSFEIANYVNWMLGMQLIRVAGEAAVPSDAGTQILIVGRVQPDDAAAPAEAGNAQLRRIALAALLGPSDCRIEVRHYLGIGSFLDDRHDVLDLGDFRYVALAREQFRRDGQVTEL